MDDLMNRSFRFDGKRSLSFDANKFTKSNTFRRKSEIGSSLSCRFTTYEKLSHSMRLADHVVVESNSSNHGSRKGAWKLFVTKIFSLKKAAGSNSSSHTRVQNLEVQYSSRRPDLSRRWPVQGW